MNSRKTKLKKLLIVSLLAVFILQASYVFAFEVKYPSVPGATNPQEIEQRLKAGEIEKSDVLPLYFKYFFNLSLIIVVLICLGVIIYGGVLHIAAGAKPAVLASSRQWIFSGLLGLLILFSSYLVLVTINPQLSLLKLGREEISTSLPGPAFLSVPASTYFEVPTGKLIEENLSHITVNTTRVIVGITHWPDCDNGRTDCWGGNKGPRDTIKYCLTDDFSFTEANCQWREPPRDGPVSCKNNEVMVAIDWPDCDGENMKCWRNDSWNTSRIKCCGPVKLTNCRTVNYPSCEEGEVLHQITGWPACQDSKTDCWDENRDTARCCTPKNVDFTACYELQSPEIEGPKINKFVSELEKVKARSEDLKRNMELLEEATEACSCGTSNCQTKTIVGLSYMTCQCLPDEPQCDIDCDKDLIIERASSTKAAIGKLEAERVRLVTLQIPILIDYLEMKKAGLLMTLPEDEIDYGQFAFQKYLLDKEEKRTTATSFDAWPDSRLIREIDGKKFTINDPATFYFPYDKWENQQVLIETMRLNPILILSNTSPEELNNMIATSVKDVFGDDVFNLLSDSDWEEIVKESLEEGTFEALESFVIALADAVSKISARILPEKLLEKAEEKTSMLFEKKLALIAQVYAQTSNPLAEKLTEFFTFKLEQILPPLLRDSLSGDILDFIDQITGGDVKKIFNTSFYDLLNQEIKDFLSTKMADLSPTLSRILSIRITEVLPLTIVADLLTSINDFLTERIEEIKSIITREAQIIADKIADAITQAFIDILPDSEWMNTIILALMEGLELVISEIVNGYVEAYIMYYLDSFLKDVYEFQEKLDDLLTLTLKDVLPKEIKKFLSSTTLDLFPEDVRDFLDDSFIDRLPKETRDFLKKSLKKFLPKEIRDILDTSLASLLGIEFIFEKTLYDYFPEDLKEIFEHSWWNKLSIEEGLTKALIDFLPEEARKPFTELSQEQRRWLFKTSILDLLIDSPLKKTPLELLKREDDKVMDILGPDVALLVYIIEDYLTPDERPALLNDLIRILKKPLTSFIRDELNNPELADILNTPFYQNYPQEVKGALNKSFADHFPELIGQIYNPTTDSLVGIINQHSDSEISQILSQSILDLFPPEVMNQLKLRLKDYLPDWFTDKKLFELLPDSWLGNIADFLGLTDQDIEEAIDETMEEIDLDKEINQIIQNISKKMASSITDASIKNIAEKTGEKISEEKADELIEKISKDMQALIEKAWGKVISEGFMLDSLENI